MDRTPVTALEPSATRNRHSATAEDGSSPGRGSRSGRGPLRSSITGLALTVLLVSAGVAQAQTQAGRILGQVIDPDLSALPGVTVTVTGPALILPQTRVTDALGRYLFVGLPPGTYRTEFQLAGFRDTAREGIRVGVARGVTIDISLQLATFTESITVTSESPLVDLTDTTMADNFTEQMLQDVPSGRNVWSVLELQAPAVVTDLNDVGGAESGMQSLFSARGTEPGQNEYQLDGVNTSTSILPGTAMVFFDYDALEELQVATGSHSAEVQGAGVYLNLVTKAGGNDFHGAAQWYYETEALQANNIDQSLADRGAGEGSGVDYVSDASVQIGGPIVRDRAWFFASFRDWRVHRYVPGFPEVETTDMPVGTVKLTLQLNPDHRLMAFATLQDFYKPYRFANRYLEPEATYVADVLDGVYQTQWQGILGNSTFVGSRLSLMLGDGIWGFRPDTTGQSTYDVITGMTSRSAQITYAPWESTRLAWHTAASHFASGRSGTHDIKMGLQYDRTTFSTREEVVGDANVIVAGTQPLFAVLFDTPVEASVNTQTIGMFAQDRWTIGSRLTLDLGLRLDLAEGWTPAQSKPAGTYGPARSFAEIRDVIIWSDLVPRLGAVYQLTPDGRTALKASYGQYGTYLSAYDTNFANPADYSFVVVPWNDLNGDLQMQPGEGGDVVSSGGSAVERIDPDLRSPRVEEFTLGLEHEISSEWVAGASFVVRKQRDLLEDAQVGLDFASDFEAVSVPDPGPDGISGTADDSSLTVYNQISGFGRNELLLRNAPERNSRYRGLELNLRKRFSNRWGVRAALTLGDFETLVGKATNVFRTRERGFTSDLLDNPNAQINARGKAYWHRPYILKLSGSWLAPHDILVSGVVRSQSGGPLGRVLSVPLNQGVVDVFAEAPGQHRLPSVTTIDFRVGKELQMSARTQLGLYADVFNLLNANTVTGASELTTTFKAPVTVLGPRILRLGFRVAF